MLRFDILLQSTNIKRETSLSVERNGERERGIREIERARRRERDRMKSLAWPLCCLCLLENKACHCAPPVIVSYRQWLRWRGEGGMEGAGLFSVGGVKWQNVLIEKKPCLLSFYSDTIKQLEEGCSQSLIILLHWVLPFGEWYHEAALSRGITKHFEGKWSTEPQWMLISSLKILLIYGSYLVPSSKSYSPCHCSTDTGHCLLWRESPASSHFQNPPSIYIKHGEKIRSSTQR